MSETAPKLFALHRGEDVTGVSGTGTVAHGVQFADGQVVLRWLGEFASTVIWESLDAAMHVHGHDGRTRVVWTAAPTAAELAAGMAQGERLDRIEGWHHRDHERVGRVSDLCAECGHRWPCDTRRMADGNYADDDAEGSGP